MHTNRDLQRHSLPIIDKTYDYKKQLLFINYEIPKFDHHRTRERLYQNSYGLLEIYDCNAIIICRYFVIITAKL